MQYGSDARFQKRIQAVKMYCASGSLEKVAAFFKIHPITLRRWIKRYQEEGKDSLMRRKTYGRHSRRFPGETERQIVLLKEHDPGLTLTAAQKILKKHSIQISLEGMRKIWKRYNLGRLYRYGESEKTDRFIDPEVTSGIVQAEELLKKGKKIQAARIVNALPSCAERSVLKKIPDHMLFLQKRLEKLYLIFYEKPFRELIDKARAIRQTAQKTQLLYTALYAGILEVHALDWVGNHREQLIVARELFNIMDRDCGRSGCIRIIRAEIALTKIRALAWLGQYKEAIAELRKLEKSCRSYPDPAFYCSLATANTVLGLYKRSRYWLKRHLQYDSANTVTRVYLATVITVAGEYESAQNILRNITTDDAALIILKEMTEARCALGQGRIDEAVKYANHALSMAEKRAIPHTLSDCTQTLAFCMCGLGQKNLAQDIIKRVAKQLKSLGITKRHIFSILLDKKSPDADELFMPTTKLAVLVQKAAKSLKANDFRKAYQYAATNKILGLLHRITLFYPEPVEKLIMKRKHVGFPKGILNLPVFHKNVPVYRVCFLGTAQVFRDEIRVTPDPTPLYASFLIHLISRKKIESSSLYNNFWSKAKNPRGSLAHFLYSLRKYLRLSPNTLFIKQGSLHFKGYITTDYQEFEQTLTRAKALERAGEWGFARKEYLRAFRLFRGEPFKKMYDPWSEHMRRVILNELETEVMHFAKSCIEHDNEIRQKKRRTPSAKCRGGNMADAKKVLEKVIKIIPDSEEIRNMVRECGSDGEWEKR